MRLFVLAAFALTSLAACALSSAPAGPSRSSGPLGAEEISSVPVSTAYEAIQTLRPQWLRRRGAISLMDPNANYPTVIIDNIKRGELDVLKNTRAEVVTEIRYVNARDATTRYGTGFRGGAIEVTTLTTLRRDTTEIRQRRRSTGTLHR
jgi:hypothetical protein